MAFWLVSVLLANPSEQLITRPERLIRPGMLLGLLLGCHPPVIPVLPSGSQYQKWRRTICHPSHLSPSCRGEVLKNKPCKYNEVSILWLLVGISLHLVSRK